LLRLQTDARAAGRADVAFFLGQVNRGILDDISNSSLSDDFGLAVNFSRGLNERFTRCRVGQALRFAPRGGRAIPETAISEELFPQNPVRASQGFEAALKATGPIPGGLGEVNRQRRMTAAVEDLLKTRLFRTDGEFNEAAAKSIETGKMSGAVGTYANIDPFVEEYVCKQLGLAASPISTQTLQRDRHAQYMSTLALIATSIEKFATEIRGLQKSETREVEEFFAKGQKGSSAMPHKRNPIGSENMTGLARLIRGYMVTSYENVSLWHERDISHSSAERVILPDATIALNYMLNRFSNIVKNLTVFPENMKRNMDSTLGLIYSQRVLLALIDKGMAREAAYDTVQPCAMEAWENQTHFRKIVEANDTITSQLTKEELDDCFNYNHHLQQVDMIFNRLGLN